MSRNSGPRFIWCSAKPIWNSLGSLGGLLGLAVPPTRGSSGWSVLRRGTAKQLLKLHQSADHAPHGSWGDAYRLRLPAVLEIVKQQPAQTTGCVQVNWLLRESALGCILPPSPYA